MDDQSRILLVSRRDLRFQLPNDIIAVPKSARLTRETAKEGRREEERKIERRRGGIRRSTGKTGPWMHSPACIHLIFGLLYLLIVMEVFQLRTNLIFHVEPDGVLWIFYPHGTLPSFAGASTPTWKSEFTRHLDSLARKDRFRPSTLILAAVASREYY